jgi:hypothetical protein
MEEGISNCYNLGFFFLHRKSLVGYSSAGTSAYSGEIPCRQGPRIGRAVATSEAAGLTMAAGPDCLAGTSNLDNFWG